MTALIAAWADLVLSKRLWLIGIAIVLLPLVLLTGGVVPTDNSSERYFIEGDPTSQDYQELIDLFGDNEYLIVGFAALEPASDVFHPDTLHALVEISDFLDTHRHVTQVRSLSTFEYLEAEGDNLSTAYLIEDLPELLADPGGLDRARATLAQEELALGTLISRDFQHTRVMARIEYRDDTSDHKVELVRELYDFMASQDLASDSYSLHLSGYVLAQERLETFAQQDMLLLVPLMLLIMSAIIFISIRSLIATLVPWLAVAAGMLLVLEIQYYLGYSHTTVDANALLPTLIIIGIGLTIHVLLDFFHAMHRGKSGPEATRYTIEHIWRPAFFTAITTAAGFYALSVTRIAPIREFALLGAIGAIVLFLFSLLLLPACLSYVRGISPQTYRVLDDGWITRLTRKIPAFTLKHRNTILVIGAATVVFSVLNIPKINVDTNYVTFFKEGSTTRQDIEYFDDNYGGAMTLDIIVDSGQDDGILDPVYLASLEQVQDWLEQRPTIGAINSLTDYLKEINQSLNFDDPSFFRLPDSRNMAAQYLLLYDSAGAQEDLSDIKDFYQRHSRLLVPITNMPALQMREELDQITSYLDETLADYDTIITGTMVLKTQQDIYVVEGIALSFIVALSVITLFFIVLFRSFKYGLLSIIPSVLPITLAGSLAGWLGVNLDLSALIVFAMTMGIAVDDAIHVMSRYLLARRAGATTEQSIHRAMSESGRAVVFSSIVLVCGFSMLCFGTVTTIMYIGVFGAVIMALALAGDLLFLPAILYLIDGSELIPSRAATEQA